MATAQPMIPAKNINSTRWIAKTANLKVNVMRPVGAKRHAAEVSGEFSGTTYASF